jgi:hypothetical protein
LALRENLVLCAHGHAFLAPDGNQFLAIQRIM